MKKQILTIFRSKKRTLSEQLLCSQLGISGTEVCRHIEELQQLGYKIRASSAGYKLISSPEALFSWEFSEREKSIHYFPELNSTMETAKQMAQNNCPAFTVIIAETQKKGRGRLQREWRSSKGGLYFTIILRPQIQPAFCYRMNFAASLVLARTLCGMFNISARVKWPNDILVNGKKLSGMLSEIQAESDRVTFLNIGIGINVNNSPSSQEPQAVSLREILGKKISRKCILAAFLDNFQDFINTHPLHNVISEWKQYAVNLNKHVKIVTTRDTSHGLAIDVDKNGALVLKLENGTIKKIIYGDCFLRQT